MTHPSSLSAVDQADGPLLLTGVHLSDGERFSRNIVRFVATNYLCRMAPNWFVPGVPIVLSIVGVVVTVSLWRRGGPRVTVTGCCESMPLLPGQVRVVAHQNLMLNGRPVVVDQIADLFLTSEVGDCLQNGFLEQAPLMDLTRVGVTIRDRGRQTTMIESAELGLPTGTFRTVRYAADPPMPAFRDLGETTVGPSSSALHCETYVLPLTQSPVRFQPLVTLASGLRRWSSTLTLPSRSTTDTF